MQLEVTRATKLLPLGFYDVTITKLTNYERTGSVVNGLDCVAAVARLGMEDGTTS